MDSKTKDALKQLQTEIRQLQSVVNGKNSVGTVEESDDDVPARKGKSEVLVQYAVYHSSVKSPPDAPKSASFSFTELHISRVTDEMAAALGYALASPHKIALLRSLLSKESETASALGETSGLSTGSLYHHLRELIRASLVVQSGRNCYRLSERGARVLLVVLALAGEA